MKAMTGKTTTHPVDLHVHTSAGSPDSTFSVHALAEAAEKAGFGTVVVTDHGNVEGVRALRAVVPRVRANVIAGLEVTTEFGDFLVFPTDEKVLEAYAEVRGARTSFDDALELGLFDPEGLVVWAHPFFPPDGAWSPAEMDEDQIERVLSVLHAVEGINGHAMRVESRTGVTDREDSMNWKAVRFARDHDLPIVYGSDAHQADRFGAVTTAFTIPVAGVQDLARAVKGDLILSKVDLYFPPE